MKLLSFDWMLSRHLGFAYKQQVLDAYLASIDLQIKDRDISQIAALENFSSMLNEAHRQIREALEEGGVLSQEGQEIYISLEYAIPRVKSRILATKSLLQEITLNLFTYRIKTPARFRNEAIVLLDNSIDNLELFHVCRDRKGQSRYTAIQSLHRNGQTHETHFRKLEAEAIIPQNVLQMVVYCDMEIPYYETFLPIAKAKAAQQIAPPVK